MYVRNCVSADGTSYFSEWESFGKQLLMYCTTNPTSTSRTTTVCSAMWTFIIQLRDLVICLALSPIYLPTSQHPPALSASSPGPICTRGCQKLPRLRDHNISEPFGFAFGVIKIYDWESCLARCFIIVRFYGQFVSRMVVSRGRLNYPIWSYLN